MTESFSITPDSYQDVSGRMVRVMVLHNSATGERAEILLNTPGGQNRSTGSGAVNGLMLREDNGGLREVLPYRRGFAGGLMAPFANRIRFARYSFLGEQYQLSRNWDEKKTRLTRQGDHAIHGLLQQELEVLDHRSTDDRAQLTLKGSFDGRDEGYPFQVDVAFIYSLDASGFTIEVSATNRSTTGLAAPFMVGWHPYIHLKGPVELAILAFDGRSEYIRSEPMGDGPPGPARDSHPTGSSIPSKDFTQGQPVGHRYWDDGFKATASARVVPRLETRVIDSLGGADVVLWQDPGCRFIQVYTGLRDKGCIAVEPMSGQTDCFNNGDGLVVIQAGETWETAFGVCLDQHNESVINNQVEG